MKDAVDLTPIPVCLQNIVKLIQAEELEYERASDSLETGPCLEYLLHKRVLEELVEFARVDVEYFYIFETKHYRNVYVKLHFYLLVLSFIIFRHLTECGYIVSDSFVA